VGGQRAGRGRTGGGQDSRSVCDGNWGLRHARPRSHACHATDSPWPNGRPPKSSWCGSESCCSVTRPAEAAGQEQHRHVRIAKGATWAPRHLSLKVSAAKRFEDHPNGPPTFPHSPEPPQALICDEEMTRALTALERSAGDTPLEIHATPIFRRRTHTVVFGPGPRVPLDREAKVRVMAYARAWNARHRQPGQHRGPLTRATTEVLEALLWGFHNAGTGACFPSYAAIATKAACCRDTVREAIRALERAGVLTWVNRIVRERVRERDLFGQWATRWRVLRTSNAYTFREAGAAMAENRPISSKSENPSGTPNQRIPGYLRPGRRERIEDQTTAEMDRDAVASRDRQLMALKAAMA
jgi:Helix-turn-helix domain